MGRSRAVERSIIVDAKPEVVFGLTGDLRQLNTWSAWAKSDPSQQMTFEGDSKAVGGKSSWKGEKTGEGVQAITERVENRTLKLSMAFKVPMEATGTAAINLAPEGEGTKVTWEMDGENNFVAKGFGLFMDMDAMIGGKFDEGLAMLKVAAESIPVSAPTT